LRQTHEARFKSDWHDELETIWDWALKTLGRPTHVWRTVDWLRLADVYRLSNMADSVLFDELHRLIRTRNCIPDVATLLRVGDWKAPRSKHWLAKNSDADVSHITREALSLIRHDPSLKSSEEAMETLWNGLYGIGIPMASTLFTLYGPIRFGVIDTFAWECLFNEKNVQLTSFPQWRRYLNRIRGLADLHGLDCRDVDAALWYAGTLRRDLPL